MEKLYNFLENKFMPIASKIADQRHVQAVRDGLVLSMPLLIVGSMFLIIANFPIPGYADFMANIFGDSWKIKITYPTNATFDLMGILVVLGVAYRLAQKYDMDAISSAAMAFCAYMLLVPNKMLFTPEGMTEEFVVSGIEPKLLGSQGVFVAIIVGLLVVELFRFFLNRDIVIKMPAGVPPTVSKSFTALIPALATLIIALVVRLAVEATDYGTIFNLINTIIGAPLSNATGSLAGALVATFFICLLWSVGLHGSAIVGAVMNPIWYALADQNRMLFEANAMAELPNIVTFDFFYFSAKIGGAGSTLVLVFMMAFIAKSAQLKQIGKLSIAPGIFNINEPVIFGTPIVMNPTLFIPFMLAPLVTTALTYVCMDIGLVALPAGITLPWTTPPILYGFLTTGGHISGAVMQIVNIAITAVIYYPFFKMYDKQCHRNEIEADPSYDLGNSQSTTA